MTLLISSFLVTPSYESIASNHETRTAGTLVLGPTGSERSELGRPDRPPAVGLIDI